MLKYHTFISMLGFVVFGLLIAGFIKGGNPEVLKNIGFDTQTLRSFYELEYTIQSYFYKHNKLPDSLLDLPVNDLAVKNSKTKEIFDYSTTGIYNYRLCTEFFTDYDQNKDINANYYSNYSNFKYKKGINCRDLVVQR